MMRSSAILLRWIISRVATERNSTAEKAGSQAVKKVLVCLTTQGALTGALELLPSEGFHSPC